mmetsp:Transcript_95509/g.308006  ORF Transcript_95509/g.308006 Transcript_95509/m.308006 type:complete len:360 (-) Transcript_95509:1974-3053(-)
MSQRLERAGRVVHVEHTSDASQCPNDHRLFASHHLHHLGCASGGRASRLALPKTCRRQGATLHLVQSQHGKRSLLHFGNDLADGPGVQRREVGDVRDLPRAKHANVERDADVCVLGQLLAPSRGRVVDTRVVNVAGAEAAGAEGGLGAGVVGVVHDEGLLAATGRVVAVEGRARGAHRCVAVAGKGSHELLLGTVAAGLVDGVVGVVAPHVAHVGQRRPAGVLQRDDVLEELGVQTDGDVLNDLQVAVDVRGRASGGHRAAWRSILDLASAIPAQVLPASDLVPCPEAFLRRAWQEVVDDQAPGRIRAEALRIRGHANARATPSPCDEACGWAATSTHLANVIVGAKAELDVLAPYEDA